MAKSYHRIEHSEWDNGEWEPTTRPEEDIFLDCVNTPRSRKSLSDPILNEICCRWQKTRLFRNFQLESPQLHYDYEYHPTIPGISLSKDNNSHKTTDTDFSISPINLERIKVTDFFGISFIERFHKALCLQSIANMSRRLAMATKATDGDIPRIGMLPYDYWSSEGQILISGHQICPSLQDKVEQLEILDLVYYFVLGRLLPARILDSWILQCRETWLIDGSSSSDYELLQYDRTAFFDYLR